MHQSPKNTNRHRQKGTTLIVSMIMLLIVLVIGTSMASIAFMQERQARNERDRNIAMQSAELALADAELDIENSTAPTSRSAIFSPLSAEGFSQNCDKGTSGIYLGLCLFTGQAATEPGSKLTGPAANSQSVPFGRFTGQTMSVSNGAPGPLPCHLPRYLIELMKDNAPGQSTDMRYIYRITAIGYGPDEQTQVVLQSVYRKAVL